MSAAEKTFIRVTNQDIYDKLLDIENHQKETNGKVKLNRWVATTALSLITVVIVTLFRCLVID